jgi:antitoxin component YwqK of YwqJK toxin-antitoxin module
MKVRKFIAAALICIGGYTSSSGQAQKSKEGEILNYTDINGMKQGRWIKKNLDGTIDYEGYFHNNEPVGTLKRFHPNGRIKTELVFMETRPKYASVKMWDDSGELGATGYYDNKMKDGVWRYFGQKEVLLYHEEYKNGKRHGMCIKYYPTGQVAEEKEWKEGILHGKWVQYYPDGKIRLKSEHVNDERVGTFYVYQANGNPLVIGAYKKDRKEGLWKLYNPKGTVEKEMVFIGGELENQEDYDAQYAKELEEAEKMKDQFPEPTNFRDNPEEYFLKRR